VVGKQARNTSRQARNARAVAQQRSRQRHRLFATAGGLVIVGLLVAIVISLVNAARPDKPGDSATKPLVAPAGATDTGAISLGRADAPVKLELYLDYMCPFCGRFERANSADVQRLLTDGTLRLELHPLSFLDKASNGTRYSTRAANAVATVADRAPDKVLAFNAALYAGQPAEDSTGLTDDEIATIAANAGVPADVVSNFGAETFQPWVATFTDTAFSKGGVTGTPTVKINGKVYKGDLYTAGPLAQAITAAKGQP
jgi:protein-disulfide isomerase